MTTPDHLSLLEALLFVSDRPLPIKELAAFVTDLDASGVEAALGQLGDRYDDQAGALQIEKVAGGYRIATRPQQGEAVKAFFRFKNRHKLSRAALETLSVVAYRQPATHPEVQDIRGVASEGVLKTLTERRLVKIVGRRDTVGKPVLYGTTREFLEHFGLASLADLPPIEELEALLAEVESTANETVGLSPVAATPVDDQTTLPADGTGATPLPVDPVPAPLIEETEPA